MRHKLDLPSQILHVINITLYISLLTKLLFLLFNNSKLYLHIVHSVYLHIAIICYYTLFFIYYMIYIIYYACKFFL